MQADGKRTEVTLLVVAGSEPARAALANPLREAGYTILEAADGAESLRLLAEQSPDLVVLDSASTDTGPPGICWRMKSEAPAAVVNVLPPRDGAVAESLAAQAPRCGADGFLTSPVETHILLAEVKAVLRRRRVELDLARLADELEAQRRFLQAIVDSAPEAVMVADERARVVVANEAAREILGRPIPMEDEDIAHHAEMRMLCPDGTPCPPRDLPLIRAVLDGESKRGEEMMVERPDGERRHLLGNVSPVRNDEGRVVGGVLIFQDITDRKRSEQELARLLDVERGRAQEARLLGTILEATPDCLAYLDADLHFVRVNHSWAGFFAMSPERMVGRDARELLQDMPEALAALEGVRDTGVPHEQQELILHGSPAGPYHTHKYVDVSVIPVRDGEGRVEGLVASARDVTDRVRQREQLLAAERARVQLAEHLTSEVSHRVKNNLMMVIGLLQMQAAQQRNSEASGTLKDTLARLLAFAGMHEQMQTTAAEDVDVLDAARRIAGTVAHVFSEREVEAVVEGTPVFYHPRIAANLAVILNELITNAVKHGAPGPEGVLRLEVRVTPENGGVRLSVWNTGDTLPSDFDVTQSPGMGLRLIWDVVVEQGRGSFALTRHRNGTLAEAVISKEALV